jgi:hypothetical protein
VESLLPPGGDGGLLAPLTPVVESLLPPSDGGGPLAPLAPVLDRVLPPSGGGGPLTEVLQTLAPPSAGDGPLPLEPADLPLSTAPASPPAGLPDLPAPAAGGGSFDAPTTPATPPVSVLLDQLVAASPFGSGVTAASPLALGAGPAPTFGAPPAQLEGGGSPPQVPDPASSAGGASAGGSGVAFGLFLALLFSLAAFALRHYSRLRLPPVQWRQFAFVAVIERPG